MENRQLYHHGVKGQKWGVLRYQNPDGSLTALGRLRYRKNKGDSDKDDTKKSKTKSSNDSPDTKAKSNETTEKPSDGSFARYKKSTKKMTEEELTTAIKRLELEKQYKKAIKDLEPDAVSRGKKAVGDILEGAAKNIGTQTLTYVAATMVNKVLASYFNDDQVINPKKGQKKD